MSGKGKRILNDDDDLAPEEDVAPASKLARKGAEDDGDDNIMVCEISKNRRVSVRSWRGKIFVDIREFYLKDGKQAPGKKGISLTMDQWNILREHVEEIDKVVTESS